MGITINGRAADALLKAAGGTDALNFLNLVKSSPPGNEGNEPSVVKTLKFEQGGAPKSTAMGIAIRKPESVAVAQPVPDAPPPSLVIRLLDDKNWLQREIPKDVEMVMIGSDPKYSDICIDAKDAEKSHVTLRRIGDFWYVIECATQRTMTINGVAHPQEKLAGGMSCLIGLGSRKLIIANPAKEPPPVLDAKQKPLVTVRIPGAASFKSSLEGVTFIGSHPSCKIRAKEAGEFAGVIFNHMNRFYLHSISGDGQLTVDGHAANAAPVPLKHLSTIAFAGKEVCMLEYPEELKVSVGLSAIPAYAGHLTLLEMTGSKPGGSHALPASGNTVTVGRSADNAIVVESLKISRRHAKISVYENSAMITDEASGNGTYVGGERISRRVLRPGERVLFADRGFILCHSD